jgi:hypothetical protein
LYYIAWGVDDDDDDDDDDEGVVKEEGDGKNGLF